MQKVFFLMDRLTPTKKQELSHIREQLEHFEWMKDSIPYFCDMVLFLEQ